MTWVHSAVPSGLMQPRIAVPTLKRWAIVNHLSGMMSRNVMHGFSLPLPQCLSEWRGDELANSISARKLLSRRDKTRIAQRFSVGNVCLQRFSPEGTAELVEAPTPFSRPFGT